LKKAYDTQAKKLKDLTEKNYLVAKDTGATNSKKQQVEQDPQVLRLNQEIRNLHKRLNA